MSAPSKRPPALPVTLSQEQLEQLATLIARKLLSEQHTDLCDQDNLPTGITRRVYLEAARKGAFKTRKVGRRVVATREALDAWMRARPSAHRPKDAPPPEPPEPNELLTIIDQNGAELR